MVMKLDEVVRGLEPQLLENLSTIHISRSEDKAQAVFKFVSRDPSAQPNSALIASENEVTIESEKTTDLIVAIDTDIPVGEQVRALQDSGLVGNIRGNLLDSDYSEGVMSRNWILMTHAGTQQERIDWLIVGRRRNWDTNEPENNGDFR